MQAISNTSPLLFLYRIGHLEWLSDLFDAVYTTQPVLQELREGAKQGYDVPTDDVLGWLKIESQSQNFLEWLAPDLGMGELSCLALALENPSRIIILDDLQARRVASAAGLQVWGTLRIVIDAKHAGFISRIAPVVDMLKVSGMWISPEIYRRVLRLADE